MDRPAYSYVHGVSTTPLLGETIGTNLDRTVDRWPDNEGVVVCHQNLRQTYAELNEAVDALAAGHDEPPMLRLDLNWHGFNPLTDDHCPGTSRMKPAPGAQ